MDEITKTRIDLDKYELKQRKIKRPKINLIVAILLIWAALVISYIFLINPDTDSYFLIATGKVIFNTKSIPIENYWSIATGMHTIIQQWLCCLLNFAAYRVGGYFGLKCLAVTLFFIFTFTYYQFFCEQSMNKYKNSINFIKNQNSRNKVFFTIVGSLCVLPFSTTRPYLITITLSVAEVMTLKNYFGNNNAYNKKGTIVLFIKILLIFLFQANWQISSLIFLFAWILAFLVPPIWKKGWISEIDIKRIGICIVLGISGSIVSLCNPNGINGSLYLIHSKKALSAFKINEMQSPTIFTFPGIIVLAVILIFFSVVIKKIQIESWVVYATLGSIFAAIMAVRAVWMLIIPLAGLLPVVAGNMGEIICEKAKNAKPKQAVIFCLQLLIAFILIISHFVLNFSINNSAFSEEQVALLDTPENTVLYTDFDTGAFFLLHGYNIYMDARPELYDAAIAGDNAILDEAADVYYGNTNLADFIDKYGFNYFATTNGSAIQYYLKYNENYVELYSGANYSIYKKK